MSRPGLPKMSPMKRILIEERRRRAAGWSSSGFGDFDANVAAAPLFNPRQHHAQFTAPERRRRTAAIEGPVETDRAGEPAETALAQVKRRSLVAAGGGTFLARDHDGALRNEEAQAAGGDTRKIHHDFDRLGRFEHIHGGRALAALTGGGVAFHEPPEAHVVSRGVAGIVVASFAIAVRHSRRIVTRRVGPPAASASPSVEGW